MGEDQGARVEEGVAELDAGPASASWKPAAAVLAILVLGWAAAGRPAGPGEFSDFGSEVGAATAVLTWRTGDPREGTVRLRSLDTGDALLFRTPGARVRDHRVSLALAPGRRYRVEVLRPGGGVAFADDIEVPSDPLRPSSLAVHRLDHRTASVEVEAPRAREIRLDLEGGGDLGTVVPGPPGAPRRILVRDIPPDAEPARVRLVLRAEDGLELEVPLEAAAFAGAGVLADRFRVAIRRRYLPVLADHFRAGGLRVGQGPVLREALRRAGLFEAWARVEPVLRGLLGDPAEPDRARRALLRDLTRLEDLDGLLSYMEDPTRLDVASAYRPVVQVREIEVLPPPAAGVRDLGVDPVPLLGEGTLSGYSGLLTTLADRPAVPRAEVSIPLSRGDLAAAHELAAVISMERLHPGLILDAFLGRTYLGCLRRLDDPARADRGEAAGPVRLRAPDPRITHLVLPLPPELLVAGKNLLRLEARPLTGVPVGELAILRAAHLLLRGRAG